MRNRNRKKRASLVEVVSIMWSALSWRWECRGLSQRSGNLKHLLESSTRTFARRRGWEATVALHGQSLCVPYIQELSVMRRRSAILWEAMKQPPCFQHSPYAIYSSHHHILYYNLSDWVPYPKTSLDLDVGPNIMTKLCPKPNDWT